LPALIGRAPSVIVTDRTVHGLHSHRFPDVPVLVVEDGEGSKTLEQAGKLHQQLVQLELDRNAFVVGVGGGVVCDLTGFVAATFLRGVSFGFVATTLLAQVDAAIGGKNGVNLDRYKNLVGTIVQPDLVMADVELLKTLPVEEVRAGLAEVIKSAAIRDAELFARLEKRPHELQEAQADAITDAIVGAAQVKVDIVNADEREAGQRRLLNFGHTFGHAVEREAHLRHGEAVAVGMVVAAQLSVRRGLLPAVDAERLTALISSVGLPTRVPGDPGGLIDALRKDKKREGQDIHFVLLEKIGHALVQAIPLNELEDVVHDLC
jgi:3-dehydroquinate synthase